MKQRILISLGQIPAKLDSVKYIGNKIIHGLIFFDGNRLEDDIIHSYDKITDEIIYKEFHKDFKIKFKKTENVIWCLMQKR
jgi:hypothetical protein